MKQKYTLSIADMEINVVTDQSPESVEHIVGIIDRKMRELALKSKRCTKNEAAVLCALDFCADKIRLKEENEELEEELEELNSKLEHLQEKLELIGKSAERLERERTRLEGENTKLREMLDNVKYGSSAGAESFDTVEAANENASECIEAENSASSEASVAETPVAEAEEKKEEPVRKKKEFGKSRVGSMFDLLTFTDI